MCSHLSITGGKLAILADIHGNLWALEAVLADLETRQVHTLLNLGDTLYGPLAPTETARRLMALNLIHIQGNEDRLIVQPPAEPARSATLRYVLKELPGECLSWLASHPRTQVVANTLFACHGTPGSDSTYLLEEVSPDGVHLSAPQTIAERLAGVSQSLIACGHSHCPNVFSLPDGKTIVNPGSVGLPAYSDDLPHFHKMETGSPHARYALVEPSAQGWQVEHIAVPYAWEQAAAAAAANGRRDWAGWLSSGRA
ncbi:MAG: metallophosphoesterase family protein [Chloroflexota bacterium]